MKSLWLSSYAQVRRSMLLVALPLGFLAGCGSSNPPPPAESPGVAVGGGPYANPTGMEAAGPALSAVTGAVPGLSSAQAATGVGSLLALARAKMPPGQFAQVSNAIPGSDALMGTAAAQGAPTTGLTGISNFRGVFEKAGISPDQVSQMVPAVGKMVSQSAGPEVGQAFMSVMK